LSPPRIDDEGKIYKGVLLITYTDTIEYYLKHPQFDLINQIFVFVLEPSSAGYADPAILAMISRGKDVLVQATEIVDRTFLESLYPQANVISIGASNWVDYKTFMPVQCDKIYDSIYITNTNPIKRNERFIKAISRIIPRAEPGYKAAIVAAGWGGSDSCVLKSLIKKHRLDGCVEVFTAMPQQELRNLISMSKCSVLLSLKEGSNRALFESMFCDVPVILISENVGVNKSYINEFTGKLVYDFSLETALISMRKTWSFYRPRDWALHNISYEVSISTLKNIISDRKINGGYVNVELKNKVNAPEVRYLPGTIMPSELNELVFRRLALIRDAPVDEIIREISKLFDETVR
jgi:glycosyltransferase involved in cell wall biosynthesis